MSLNFEFWIGNRYVRSRSSNRFVSLISTISMLGIAIAVSVLILVLSVVNGFERELQDRLLAMTAHASIESMDGRMSDWKGLSAVATDNARVKASAPFIDGQALLVFGERLSGAALRGIDPVAEDAVSGVGGTMLEGELGSLREGSFNVVLGVELQGILNEMTQEFLTINSADHEMAINLALATRTGAQNLDDPELLWRKVLDVVSTDAEVGSAMLVLDMEENQTIPPGGRVYVAPRLFLRTVNDLDRQLDTGDLFTAIATINQPLSTFLLFEMLEQHSGLFGLT